MAVVESDYRTSRVVGGFSPLSRGSILSDDRELQSFQSEFEDDNDPEGENGEGQYGVDGDDVDSGAGSDDFDLSDLGEIGAEFCQIGNKNCSLPFELYDLPDLTGVLSLETWNNCLTEEERFSLAEFLPDMEHVTFMRTLVELFNGCNFHFGSPLTQLFNLLKGGICEPRVALYRRGLNFFEKRRHYHLLCDYQNSMVRNIIKIRDAWEDCAAYSIEERLRYLNILRSKKSLMNDGGDRLGSETDSSSREESIYGFWTGRSKNHAKSDENALYSLVPVDVSSCRGVKSARKRNQNSKGLLDVLAPNATSKKDPSPVLSNVNYGLRVKSKPSILPFSLHQGGFRGHDHTTARHYLSHKGEEDHEGVRASELDIQKKRRNDLGVSVSKTIPLKLGKRRHDLRRYDSDLQIGPMDDEDTESYVGMPYSVKNGNFTYARNKNAQTSHLTGKSAGSGYDVHGKRKKQLKKHNQASVEDQMQTETVHGKNLLSKGTSADWPAVAQTYRDDTVPEEALSIDHEERFGGSNFRNKKRRMVEELRLAKENGRLGSKNKAYQTYSPQMIESSFPAGYSARTSGKKSKRKYEQNGGMKLEDQKSSRFFNKSEETESDSSEEDLDDDAIHLRKSSGYQFGTIPVGPSASARSDAKKINKAAKKVKNENDQLLRGAFHPSVKNVGLGERSNMPEIEIFSSKGKKRDNMNESSNLHFHTNEQLAKNESTPNKLAKSDKQFYKSVDNQMQVHPGEWSQGPTSKPCQRNNKGKVDIGYSVLGSNQGYPSALMEEVDLPAAPNSVVNQAVSDSSKGQMNEVHMISENFDARSPMALAGCNTLTRKRKGKSNTAVIDDSDEPKHILSTKTVSSKKQVKKKVSSEPTHTAVITSDALVAERGISGLEPEAKPIKKPFTLITPSIHSGFSFSIIHLLTAVRMAMVSRHFEDASDVQKHPCKTNFSGELERELDRKFEGGDSALPSYEGAHVNCSEHIGQKNIPSLTVQEIVARVRCNPGDPCILETQEPLQDLVRGVLRIFSSRTAPLGAKGWKALVSYEKSTKCWSWVGPISTPSDQDMGEEETSSEAWGLPLKMLVKLVDSFSNWLKSGQETLKLIGGLPPPPMPTPNIDEKDRFRDLRAQKSLTTINPSSDEVRSYFRKEEFLRYSIPDRAFSYTAADGRKSTVAPLRRCGGKPTSKARDHFMLKPDRPPHVTILCLVRDAAARLPGSIGTRADVCTLIRDSQYIVDDVSDAQVNQVVSGALDRLHYEIDPCVQFDGERKLWVYLHREREEEDFEDDGTSSTKKWKRPRKLLPDLSLVGGDNDVISHGTGDFTGEDLVPGYNPNTEFNIVPSSIHSVVKTEIMYNSPETDFENTAHLLDSGKGGIQTGHPNWEVIGLNPLQEGKMLCLENSTNEDFDDETFSRERPVGLLSAGLT